MKSRLDRAILALDFLLLLLGCEFAVASQNILTANSARVRLDASMKLHSSLHNLLDVLQSSHDHAESTESLSLENMATVYDLDPFAKSAFLELNAAISGKETPMGYHPLESSHLELPGGANFFDVYLDEAEIEHPMLEGKVSPREYFGLAMENPELIDPQVRENFLAVKEMTDEHLANQLANHDPLWEEGFVHYQPGDFPDGLLETLLATFLGFAYGTLSGGSMGLLDLVRNYQDITEPCKQGFVEAGVPELNAQLMKTLANWEWSWTSIKENLGHLLFTAFKLIGAFVIGLLKCPIFWILAVIIGFVLISMFVKGAVGGGILLLIQLIVMAFTTASYIYTEYKKFAAIKECLSAEEGCDKKSWHDMGMAWGKIFSFFAVNFLMSKSMTALYLKGLREGGITLMSTRTVASQAEKQLGSVADDVAAVGAEANKVNPAKLPADTRTGFLDRFKQVLRRIKERMTRNKEISCKAPTRFLGIFMQVETDVSTEALQCPFTPKYSKAAEAKPNFSVKDPWPEEITIGAKGTSSEVTVNVGKISEEVASKTAAKFPGDKLLKGPGVSAEKGMVTESMLAQAGDQASSLDDCVRFVHQGYGKNTVGSRGELLASESQTGVKVSRGLWDDAAYVGSDGKITPLLNEREALAFSSFEKLPNEAQLKELYIAVQSRLKYMDEAKLSASATKSSVKEMASTLGKHIERICKGDAACIAEKKGMFHDLLDPVWKRVANAADDASRAAVSTTDEAKAALVQAEKVAGTANSEKIAAQTAYEQAQQALRTAQSQLDDAVRTSTSSQHSISTAQSNLDDAAANLQKILSRRKTAVSQLEQSEAALAKAQAEFQTVSRSDIRYYELSSQIDDLKRSVDSAKQFKTRVFRDEAFFYDDAVRSKEAAEKALAAAKANSPGSDMASLEKALEAAKAQEKLALEKLKAAESSANSADDAVRSARAELNRVETDEFVRRTTGMERAPKGTPEEIAAAETQLASAKNEMNAAMKELNRLQDKLRSAYRDSERLKLADEVASAQIKYDSKKAAVNALKTKLDDLNNPPYSAGSSGSSSSSSGSGSSSSNPDIPDGPYTPIESTPRGPSSGPGPAHEASNNVGFYNSREASSLYGTSEMPGGTTGDRLYRANREIARRSRATHW